MSLERQTPGADGAFIPGTAMTASAMCISDPGQSQGSFMISSTTPGNMRVRGSITSTGTPGAAFIVTNGVSTTPVPATGPLVALNPIKNPSSGVASVELKIFPSATGAVAGTLMVYDNANAVAVDYYLTGTGPTPGPSDCSLQVIVTPA